MENIVAIWKPKGMTSHDVIDALRSITSIKTIGHAGTLDPLAEGVLVVGIGRDATKTLSEEVKKEKEYEALIRLGMTSSTDDEEGEKKENSGFIVPTEKQVHECIAQFVGSIEQIPPKYSAIKVKGKAAYKRIRSGESFEMKARTVQIMQIALLSYSWPDLNIRVQTGPGVYIRSLARDIGEALHVGGYLATLTRTRVGTYTSANTLSLEQFAQKYKKS